MRAFRERLSEPLHLNALSLIVKLFGSYHTKVAFNGWCGELLAVREFNETQPMRKIESDRFSDRGEFSNKRGGSIRSICCTHSTAGSASASRPTVPAKPTLPLDVRTASD